MTEQDFRTLLRAELKSLIEPMRVQLDAIPVMIRAVEKMQQDIRAVTNQIRSPGPR